MPRLKPLGGRLHGMGRNPTECENDLTLDGGEQGDKITGGVLEWCVAVEQPDS